jgi:hypothetical protein
MTVGQIHHRVQTHSIPPCPIEQSGVKVFQALQKFQHKNFSGVNVSK